VLGQGIVQVDIEQSNGKGGRSPAVDVRAHTY
jgi:hypothetical protein